MSVYKYKTKQGEKWYVKVGNITKRGFNKKSEATHYEAKLKLISKDEIENITFYTLVKDYLENGNKNVTYGTYQKKEVVCRRVIVPNTQDKNIFRICELDCRRFRDCVEVLDYSTEYKNYILKIYKGIFKHATKYFKLKESPTYVIEPFKKTFQEKTKKKEKELNIWNNDEFVKFIDCVDKPVYKVFFIVLFQTGMRLGEIQALTWNDFVDGKLNVNKSLTTKTKKGSFEIKEPKTLSSIRSIVLGEELNTYVEEYEKAQSKIPGFSHNWYMFGGIEPLPATSITRIKDIAIKKAHVRRITIHEFRHSHASNLISSGMNIVAVSRRLGHENVDITLKVYTHLMKESESQVISYLDKSSQNLLTHKKSL